MTVLVTGADGQLGRALCRLLPDARFHDLDLDVTSRSSLDGCDWAGVTAVVNAAAWTAVDAAEQQPLAAWDVNASGVAQLADQARRRDLTLVQVSTDYVLGGEHTGPAPVGAALDPLGAYGVGKAAGELAARLAPRHYVVRTSWLFGDGPNFVRTMLALSAKRDEVTVVDDQVGRPTYAPDLAGALVALLASTRPYGTYHCTGGGEPVSWSGLAELVLAGTGCRVVPVSTGRYRQATPGTAVRPASSVLADGPLVLRDWRAALAEYLAQERAAR